MNITEKTPFSLEMDDRTEEEKARKQSHISEMEPAPMDSNYQEDLGDMKKKIRFNTNFGK